MSSNDTGASAADSLGIREAERMSGVAARVLMDCQQPRCSTALSEDLADAVAGRLGRYQRDIDVFRYYRTVADIAPWANISVLPCRERGFNVVSPCTSYPNGQG